MRQNEISAIAGRDRYLSLHGILIRLHGRKGGQIENIFCL